MAVSLRSQCKILVVEPESLEFECLKLNLPLNRTIFYHGVLSDVDGYVDFYSVPNSADSSIIQPQPNLRPSTSKSWRLDSIFSRIELHTLLSMLALKEVLARLPLRRKSFKFWESKDLK